MLDVAVELLAESAPAGGTRVGAEGVYSADDVSAFDPADADADAEKDEEAPAPLVPEDALAWM